MLDLQAQGLLFDMDGVLVSSIASAERCWRRWAKEYGVAGWETLQIPHGVPSRDIAQLLVPGMDVAAGVRRIEDIEIADAAGLTVLPGARELLESLPLERWAIVTSATRRLLVARLAAAGLPVPERLISADMVVRGKPDPEPYVKGAARLGFAVKDCVVFEDAPGGVKAGVAAGCRVVGVLGTSTREALLGEGAEWLVESLAGVTAKVAEGGLRISVDVQERT
jgi:sugar-phosphatase